MKKKFACLMMALLFCVSALAGCSLVSRVDSKYYNATVATITYEDGTVETISKRDLLVAYNSYGYYYVDSYGYETEEAINLTLDSLIETRVIIKAVEDYYDDLDDENEKLLNEAETSYLWQETYDTVVDNLRSYYNDLSGNTDSDDEDDEDTSNNIFQDYEKQAVWMANSDGTYSIYRTQTSTAVRDSDDILKTTDGTNLVYDFEYEASDGTYTFQEIMYNKILSLTTGSDSGSKVWKSALAEYINDVRDNYSYEDLGTDKECFMFEMNRIYKILRDNYLVQKFTELFDYEEYGNDEIASLSVNDILTYYSSKVRAAYTDYMLGGDNPDVLNDLSSTYYIPEGKNADTYFSIAYIKIEFSDSDAEKVSDLMKSTSEYYAYHSVSDGQTELENLYGSLSVTVCDEKTGEATSTTVTAGDLLTMIQKDLASDTENDDDYLKKADAFRKYLYLYNDDDTLKNADYNAVFGVDVNGNVLLNDDFSEYDEEYQENICEAIKALYNNGQAKIGDITEWVRTDDGIYLFFYAGEISNLFDVDYNFDISKDASNIEILANTRLNVFSSKTIFDAIYEALYSDGFSTYESLKVTDLLSKTTRVIHKDQIEDLY